MSHPYTVLSTLSLAFAVVSSGCATQSASQQLAAARVAYQNASSGPAGTEVPNKVHEAKVALARAERAHERDARSDEEKDLAYIAERKSLLAQQEAEKRIAVREIEAPKAKSLRCCANSAMLLGSRRTHSRPNSDRRATHSTRSERREPKPRLHCRV